MNFFIDLSDKRNNHIANALSNMGHDVNKLGFENKQGTAGDVFIFSPAKKFSSNEVQNIPAGTIIVAGNISDEIKQIFNKNNITFINLMSDESFVIENAKLTAEGILALIIGCTEKSIFENKILILGSGRVGLATASLLKKLNINSDFAIFHNDKFAVASFYCNKVILKDELPNEIGKYDIIINTVPTKILSDEILNKIDKKASILEIASVNCLNINLLKLYTFKYILAPALPQVYSSESAGNLMLNTILKQLKLLEEKTQTK